MILPLTCIACSWVCQLSYIAVSLTDPALVAGARNGQQPALPVPHDCSRSHCLPCSCRLQRCALPQHAARCRQLLQGQGKSLVEMLQNCVANCPRRKRFSYCSVRAKCDQDRLAEQMMVKKNVKCHVRSERGSWLGRQEGNEGIWLNEVTSSSQALGSHMGLHCCWQGLIRQYVFSHWHVELKACGISLCRVLSEPCNTSQSCYFPYQNQSF